MSEKPVVNLLIKIRTDLAKATGALDKLEGQLKRVSELVNSLAKKRIVVDLDLSRLDKQTVRMAAQLDIVRETMEKALAGKDITKAEKTRFTKAINQLKVIDRWQKDIIRKKDEEIGKLDDAYKGAKAGVTAIKAQRDALAEQADIQRDLVSARKKELTPLETMRSKIDDIKKAFIVLPEEAKDTAEALAVGGRKVKDILKLGIGADRLAVLKDAAVEYNEQLKAAKPNLQAQYDLARDMLADKAKVKKLLGTEGIEAVKASEELVASRKGFIQETAAAQKAIKNLTTAQEKMQETTKAPTKERGPWPFTFLDMLKRMRVEKMPLMGAIRDQIPDAIKEATDRTAKLATGMEQYSKETSKAGATVTDELGRGWNNIVHQFGIASTYVGQFDRRMRYLSRDIYIMGIYARQLAQSWKTQFQFVAKASVDLGGALEDVGSAWEDVLEPVGDILAPMFEKMAEMVEGLVDIFDELGINYIIAGFLMLGGVFARILAPALRFVSVLNLFLKSSVPMLRQQRELAAAQNEYAKQTQNVGMQYALLIARAQEMMKANKDTATTVEWLNVGMREQEALLAQIRENLVRAGGDPSRMMKNWAMGFQVVNALVKEGHITTQDLMNLAKDPENLMQMFRRLGMIESPLGEWREDLEAKTPWQRAKGSASDFLNLLRLKTKATFDSPEMIMMSEMPARLAKEFGMTEEAAAKMLEPLRDSLKQTTSNQKKLSLSTKRGITTSWKMVGAWGGMIVSGAILSGVMTEMQPAMQSITSAVQSLLEPFTPLIEAIGDVAEGFADWISGLGDSQQLLVTIGTLLGGKMLLGFLKGLWKSGAIQAKLKGFFLPILKTLGTILMTSLKAIPVIGWILIIVGALALLHKAWKENWFGIRDFTKKVLQSIGNFFEKYIIGPLKWIKEQLAKIFGPAKGTKYMPGPPLANFNEFQRGGYIERTGLGLLHRGETVVPAGRDLSRSTITNHIYVTVHVDKTTSENVDEYQIGRVVSEEIANQLRRKM